MVRKTSPKRWILNRDLKQVREWVLWISGGTALQAEGTAQAKNTTTAMIIKLSYLGPDLWFSK